MLNRHLVFLCFLFSSCSHYQFSNLHVQLPQGARTIGIESVFDTSRLPVPHELLWDSLQKEFISRGHLALTSVDYADIYVRTLIKNTVTRPFEIQASSKTYEFNNFINPDTKEPFLPEQYIDMYTADQYSKREALSFTVEVEIWDTRKKTQILKKDYPVSGSYNIFASRATLENRFLRSHESLGALFASLSKTLSQSIVNDFYSLSF